MPFKGTLVLMGQSIFLAQSVHNYCAHRLDFYDFKAKKRQINSQMVQVHYFRPPQSSVYHEKCSAILIKEFGARLILVKRGI